MPGGTLPGVDDADLETRLALALGLDADGRRVLASVLLEVALDDSATFDANGPRVAAPPDRYRVRALLGAGGMGQVWSVEDTHLGRVVARKELQRELAGHGRARALFLDEARIAAQLQHPGIPPVHELGTFPDGRPWFTMEEVRGRTLAEVIEALHAHPDAPAFPFTRLVDALARVADAVGYAHARGVVHRDLKPSNVMLGEHGEVLVLDWGIAKVVGTPEGETPVHSRRGDDPAHRTRVGSVTGTPAYMAPEQADGEVDAVGPAADVYALGAILRDLLVGPPKVQLGGPVPEVLPDVPADAPDELVALCRRAMAWASEHRIPDGAAFAREVRAWLEGARRREQAEGLVAQARALLSRADEAERGATPAAAEGADLLARTPAWAGEDAKAAGWRALERADTLRREARRHRLEAEVLLDGALTHAPGWEVLHAELAGLHLAEHQEAEARGDVDTTERAALRLRRHADALATGHPTRRRAEAWLAGTGAVSLTTDPPGAEVTAWRYVPHGRRLVLVREGVLGATPLVAAALPMGRWLLVVSHPACNEVRYPVELGRGAHWDGVPPEGGPAPALGLPPRGSLGPDDVLVPAGWFRVGGDALASASVPGRRVWCDAFVVRRHPLTNRDARALGWPAEGPDDHPLLHVDWREATELAAREAARTGQPWRLPAEHEWEKAGRGVDGRVFPWGDGFDPSYACLGDSHAGPPTVEPIGAFPLDESPYGVRGLAGNVRDWCADPWRPEGPPTPGDRVRPAEAGDPTAWRVRRGGSWGDAPTRGRLADRDWYYPHSRYDYVGVRLVRAWSRPRP